MKYMTFDPSHAFAGVANMLEQRGVSQEDRDLALGMELPYLFVREGDAYLAGPMLQSAKWFNRYLPTLGYELVERQVPKEEVPAFLEDQDCAMLEIHLTEEDKHAVVCLGKTRKRFFFLNNKWKDMEGPEQFALAPMELLGRLDDMTVISTLKAVPKALHEDGRPLFAASIEVLGQLKTSLRQFCAQEHTPRELRGAVDTLFRPLLLDGIAMLELAGNIALADRLKVLQGQLMEAVRGTCPQVPAEKLDVPELLRCADDYARWIQEKIDR